MSGTQKAPQNKEVWVPVFASGETGMTTDCTFSQLSNPTGSAAGVFSPSSVRPRR
jgi:hypothetical protein